MRRRAHLSPGFCRSSWCILRGQCLIEPTNLRVPAAYSPLVGTSSTRPVTHTNWHCARRKAPGTAQAQVRRRCPGLLIRTTHEQQRRGVNGRAALSPRFSRGWVDEEVRPLCLTFLATPNRHTETTSHAAHAQPLRKTVIDMAQLVPVTLPHLNLSTSIEHATINNQYTYNLQCGTGEHRSQYMLKKCNS